MPAFAYCQGLTLRSQCGCTEALLGRLARHGHRCCRSTCLGSAGDRICRLKCAGNARAAARSRASPGCGRRRCRSHPTRIHWPCRCPLPTALACAELVVQGRMRISRPLARAGAQNRRARPPTYPHRSPRRAFVLGARPRCLSTYRPSSAKSPRDSRRTRR